MKVLYWIFVGSLAAVVFVLVYFIAGVAAWSVEGLIGLDHMPQSEITIALVIGQLVGALLAVLAAFATVVIAGKVRTVLMSRDGSAKP